MKKRVMTFVAACLALSVCAQKNGHTGYPITHEFLKKMYQYWS